MAKQSLASEPRRLPACLIFSHQEHVRTQCIHTKRKDESKCLSLCLKWFIENQQQFTNEKSSIY